MQIQFLGVIPARYASTRFPGKPLINLGGKTMIERVYLQTKAALYLSDVVVATDDDKIAQEVHRFGGKVMLTGSHHTSGTERLAEVAEHFPQAKVLINIQGDEPFIQPAQIDEICQCFIAHQNLEIATLARPISFTESEVLQNPNIVKVVKDIHNFALYFSRSLIPYLRETIPNGLFYQHIGLYGYRRETLLQITQLKPTPLEQIESLEQLRWLVHGYKIFVGKTHFPTYAIDTPDDLEKIKHLL